MKRILSLLGILCMISVTTSSIVQSAPISTGEFLLALGTKTFEGTLMKIDGKFYVIMDSSGKDHRVHVDGNTSITGNVQPGAKVKAEVTSDGRASALKKVGSE